MVESTVSVDLPADVYDRFEAVARDDERDEVAILSDLVRDHVTMAEAISQYVDTDDSDGREAASTPTKLSEIGPPIAELLGFDLTDVGPGEAEVSFSADSRHANPMGTLHGGVVCDIGDAAMGIALASTLEAEESFTTLELDVKYTKPVWDAELTAHGEVRKRGRRTALVECSVTDEDGSLVASLTSLCLILRGEEAEGR